MSKGEYNHQIEYGMDIEQHKPDEISPYSLPSDAVDNHFMPPDEKLREEIADILRLWAVGVSVYDVTDQILALLPQIRREEDIKKEERQRVLDTVDEELWKRRQMFDYNGNPTNKHNEVTLSDLTISSPRWHEICHKLKEE